MDPIYCILMKNGNKPTASPASSPSSANAMSKETPLSPSQASSSFAVKDPSVLKDSSMDNENGGMFGDDLIYRTPEDSGNKLFFIIELRNYSLSICFSTQEEFHSQHTMPTFPPLKNLNMVIITKFL